MSMEAWKQKARSWWEKLGKYRYTVLILLLGVALMLVPFERKSEPAAKTAALSTGEEDLEARLGALLRNVDGAGAVSVLLTLETGPLQRYQEDAQSKSGSDGTQLQKQTVLVTAGGEESPIPVQTTYPTYKGAVVVCEGADRASVKLDIIRAVSSLTGLGSDKITVIKMKGNWEE